MPRRAPKLENLSIEETSGVDHPAHLHEGWMVMKGATATDVADVLDALTKEDDMPEDEKPEDAPEGTEADAAPAEDTAPEAEAEVEAAAEDAPPAGPQEDIDAANAVIEEQAAIIESMKAEIAALTAEEDMAPVEDAAPDADATPETPAPAVDDEDPLLKSAPEGVREMVKALRAEKAASDAALVETAATLLKEREDRLDGEAVEKARGTLSHLNLDPAHVGPALRRLAAADPALHKAVETALLAADAQQESAGIFAELGKSAAFGESSAADKIDGMAKAMVSAGQAKTYAQAVAKVAKDYPDLYTEHVNEKGA